MNRCLVNGLALALLALSLRPASAQEEAAATKPPEPPRVPAELEERYQKMADQLQQPPAKRDFKVVAVELQKTPLFRPDPKLFENKFVARLTLRPGGVDVNKPGDVQAHSQRLQLHNEYARAYPDELRKLLYVGNMSLVYASQFGDGGFGGFGGAPATDQEQVNDHFRRLAEQSPDELEPPKRQVEFLTSADSSRDIVPSLLPVTILGRQGFGGTSIQEVGYFIYAPTADEAEQRARAIVQLYDGGFSRPMQRFLLEQGQKSLEQARGQYAELAKLAEATRVENEKLAKPSEISPDILSQLKAQKVMVAVELAGLSARVKACDAMLTDPKKLEISTLQSISDMKVKAEIERVGIKEKLDQINIFIGEGDQRQGAQDRLVTIQSKEKSLRRTISGTDRLIRNYAELFDLYAPFAVPDNQITVGPIEWTQQ